MPGAIEATSSNIQQSSPAELAELPISDFAQRADVEGGGPKKSEGPRSVDLVGVHKGQGLLCCNHIDGITPHQTQSPSEIHLFIHVISIMAPA